MRSLLTLLAVLPLAAAAQTESCPMTLPAEAVTVKAPPGWHGYSRSFVRLTGYGMMAGPPESMTYLIPGGGKKLKDGAENTWGFAPEDEKWLYCTYDGSSVVQISKPMGGSATECTARHRRTKHGLIEGMVVTCR